jgi:radical SAM superfamily enzyme YgiQ (UPF0313 family)
MSSSQIDILLVRPHSNVPLHTFPLGLGYLASSLIKNQITVDIKDFLVDNISIDEVVAFIRREKIKIIGVSCCTNEVSWVRKFTNKIKSTLAVKIVVGGPHPSGVMGKIYTDIENVDFSIYSEGEYALPLLVKAILGNDITENTLGGIPNLIWRNNNKIVKNFLELPERLDDINFPAWELIKLEKYFNRTPHGFVYRRSPFASTIATRGCPYNCSFCSTGNIHGRRLRKRSPDNIITEIRYLHKKYGVKEILFEDDNFTFDPNFVKDFCNKIIEANLNIFFNLPNGICIDTLNEEMLRIMKKANFYSFAVGVESGSQRILKKMKKAANLDMTERKIAMAKRYGFYITGFFIIGHPGETIDDINATIRYAKRLKIDKAAFSKYIPLPGTESYNNLIDDGKLNQWEPFEALSARDIPYSPEGIAKDELRKCIKRAIKSFYFRPSIILRHVFRLNCLFNIKTLVYIVRNFILFSARDKISLKVDQALEKK